jgi:steroid 5-alpha reductase family enzyme
MLRYNMARLKLLEKVAPEEGTYSVKFTFKDENGDLVTPSTLAWWLSDLTGAIINGRSEVVADSLASPWYLVLSGPDLQMHNSQEDHDYRIVTLRGTYNSDMGNDLPLTYAVMFKLQNLLIIAKPLYISALDHLFTGDCFSCSVEVL